MKMLIAAIVLVSANAMAFEIGYEGNQDYDVRYISWCENNQVKYENAVGQVQTLANCDDAGLVCKSATLRKLHGAIHTASCQPAQ